MPNKITQILLTTRNSSWGVMVNPVATNTYQHILSWESEELKDWFINKYLFNDENFDYKSKIKEMPNKPLSIISDTKCTFKVDTKDYDLPMYELRQKDLAIILEADCEFDDEGKPFNYQNEKYTFWALSEISAPVGHIVQYTGELDIFFTYNIKDIFNNNKVGISRAHQDRYNEFKYPNVLKDSPNSFSEDFFNNIIEYYPDSTDLLKLREKNGTHSYFITGQGKQDFKVLLAGYYNPVNGIGLFKVSNVPSIPWLPNNLLFYGLEPYLIVDLTLTEEEWSNFWNIPYESYLSFINSLMSHSPNKYCGIISIPFELTRSAHGGLPLFIEVDVDNEKIARKTINYRAVFETFTDSVTIGQHRVFKDFDYDALKNLNDEYNYKNEGKIYHSDIYNLKIIDFIGSTYNIPFSKIVTDSSFNIEISGAINTQGVYYKISVKELESNVNNYVYGLEGVLPLSQDVTVNNWDEFEVYNKSRFDNSVKIAKRHELQSVISGGLNSVGSVASFMNGNPIASASSLVEGFNEISNARDELNSLMAQQKDMMNSPNSVTNGSPMLYSSLNDIMKYTDIIDEGSGLPSNGNKEFLQIITFKPQEIIREKIAWIFHISGVNLASTFYNINELINNRYYFNYIKTSMSVFENMKIDLSQNIRNIIDKSMLNGITIWHIRDKETFKGIKHYNINNVEMSLLNGN